MDAQLTALRPGRVDDVANNLTPTLSSSYRPGAQEPHSKPHSAAIHIARVAKAQVTDTASNTSELKRDGLGSPLPAPHSRPRQDRVARGQRSGP